MQIRIVGHANMSQAQAQFTALTAQIKAMNEQLARSAMMPAGGSPAGFQRSALAARAATSAYSNALAATGAFRVEQLRINDAVHKNTELLGKQKLAFRETFGPKSRNMMRAVYREQLAMQQSIARVTTGGIGDGRTRMTMAVPTSVHQSWDTLNNRIGMFRTRLASASAQLVNWGKNTQWAGRQLMTGLTMPVMAFGVAAGVMAYKVDKELTRIAKVYDTTFSANTNNVQEAKMREQELIDLRVAGMETATAAAKRYGSSITDTLQAQGELAATGQTGTRLQESTTQVMRIATLGEVEHAQATKALIALQATLGHTVRQTADDFNYINAIENATSLTTDDFTAAIPRALGPMKEMGGSLQDLATLLVAMKERGVAAGEGANAIKSMMQRLYRPSRQVREEWQQLAGLDPLQFVENSGGDVMKILPQVADAVRDLDQASRVKLLAGLFGTYQVARMSAMLKGLDDMKNGVGQVSRVMDINQQSTKEWADTAEGELDAIANSAAGKFKIAFESLKAQLAELGPPFLQVASVFLKVTGAILGFFNSMPGWAKKVAIFGLILGALVGPAIMLIGLFANFAGNMGRFVAFSLRAVTSFEFLNKAQWAAKVSAELAERAFTRQGTAASALTTSLQAMTVAAQEAATAMGRVPGMGMPGGVGAPIAGQPTISAPPIAGMGGTAGPVRGPVPAGYATAPVTHVPHLPANSGQTYQIGGGAYNADGSRTSIGPRPGAQAAVVRAEQSRILAGETAIARAQQQQAIARNAAVRATQQQANAQAILAERVQRTGVFMNGAALATGAMGIAMAGMLLSAGANEGSWRATVGHISKWLLIAAIAIPAAKTLALWTSGAAAASATWASNLVMSTISYALLNYQARGQVGLLATMTAGALGFGRALNAALGPIGWIALGVTAIAGTLFAIRKHNKAIEEAQRRQRANQTGLTNQTKEWAKTQDEAIASWRKFQDLKMSQEQVEQYDKDVEFYKSEDQKDKTKAFNDLGPIDQQNQLMLKYIELIKSSGLTADEAENHISAFLFATGKGSQDAADSAAALKRELGDLDKTAAGWMEVFKTTSGSVMNAAIVGNKDNAKSLGMQTGQIFMEGFLDPGNTPQVRQDYYKQLKAQILQPWERIAKDIAEATSGDDTIGFQNSAIETAAAGPNAAEELRKIYLETDVDDRAKIFEAYDNGSEAVLTNFQDSVDSANLLETSIVGGAAAAGEMDSHINHLGELFDDPKFGAMTFTFEDAQKEVDKMAAMVGDTTEMDLSAQMGDIFDFDDAHVEEFAKNMTDAELKTALAKQNALNMAFGFQQASEDLEPAEAYAQALAFWTHKTKEEITDAADEVVRLGHGMNAVKMDFDFSDDNMKSMLKTGYEGVQSDLSDLLTDKLDADIEAEGKTLENTWDTAIDNMQKAQEAASDRLDARHEKEEERFDARWERRKNAVEKAYDDRIDKVNEAIEAEQKAEEIRQKIFEAEKTRLDRLAESANRTIDFNMALQTGDLDEAAKIRNDMDASAQNWALSDAGEAGGSASQRRQDALGVKADNLGDKKDAAMDALDKAEEAEKKSLERRQEAEKKSLEDRQEANMEYLQAQADAAKDAFNAESDARKKSLEDQLNLFKSFVPKNQKQLKAWMSQMGIDYEHFGLDILNPKAKRWGKWFKSSLTSNIRDAGVSIASDNMWEQMGADVAKDMLLGMGFSGMGQFKKFVLTGKLPADFGKPKKATGTQRSFAMGKKAADEMAVYHSGGEVMGGSGSGRKGVARTHKGLHSSETMALLQKKEFVVNKDSASKYGAELEAINKGIYDPTPKGVMGGSGMAPGLSGIASGIMGSMLAAGIARSFFNTFMKKQDEMSAVSGDFGAATAGTYGNTSFTAEQLENARTIASVGRSLGASSRDIVIALMTAMQESTLRNLDYGDRDSVGLFQQRDAWGSFAARTNPAESARMFFKGGAAGQRGLFDFPDRDSMSLAQAAQAVQVSAFPDAYAKWADEAQAIFNALRAGAASGGAGYVPGSGGAHKPTTSTSHGSIHDSYSGFPAIDIPVATGNPAYAVGDGVITRSEDLKGNDGRVSNGGYYSYGRVIQLKLDGGPEVLYAHLDTRGAVAGQRVKGGATIGRTGNTGHSFGSHLHFGAKGASPLAFLKSGGMTLNDGMAMLHRGETVLTAPLSKDLQNTVQAFGKVSNTLLKKKSGVKDKSALPASRGRDGAGSSSESWGNETTRPDGYSSEFWTYANMAPAQAIAKTIGQATADMVKDSGAKASLRLGTLNTYYKTGAKATAADLSRLIPNADFLALTEMSYKFGAIKKFLASKNWGLIGGKGQEQQEAVMAYNKATQSLDKAGTRKLGDLTSQTAFGGKKKRYANYGLFTDRATGRKSWQVAAHTQPTNTYGGMPLFREQFNNLDKLVKELRGSGAPVFVAGDVNENPGNDFWRTPEGLKAFTGKGVDWIFSDPKLVKLLKTTTVGGMHTDHGAGAIMSNFTIPSHKNGAQNIKFDNVLTNLHRGEGVLTEEQNSKYRNLANNIDKVAMGGNSEYNLHMHINEPGASPDQIADVVIRKIQTIEARRPTRRRS